MRLFSKTIDSEVEVDTYDQTQPNGDTLTLIKHYSLQNVIFNQLNLAKDPDSVQLIRENNESYPVYKCIIWDKERNRCVTGVGSARPESLESDIAKKYPDETASNRAFDRAALVYLQFPGKQLSDVEMGLYLPININEDTNEIIDSSPVDPIASAPIGETVQEVAEEETPFMNAPVNEELIEEPDPEPDVTESDDIAKAGDTVIQFGKYRDNPTKVRDILNTEEGMDWVTKLLRVSNPSKDLVPFLDALRIYKDSLN